MKKYLGYFSLAIFLLLNYNVGAQSMKVMPDGLVIPKGDHTAIILPDDGQMVYDTVTHSVWYYDNIIWKEVGSDNLGNHIATTTLDMDDNPIENVSTPANDMDAANKAYVDQDMDQDSTNELQTITASVVGDTMYLTDGNYLIVPGISDANHIKDFDDNVYHEVEIGTQVWLLENMKATHYMDGTPIPKIEDAADWDDWDQSWDGTEYTDTYDAYSWYNNDSTTYNKFGILYNWGVVDATINGGKNICPIGYEVPSSAQLDILIAYADNNIPPSYSPVGVTIKLPPTEFWTNVSPFPFGAKGNNASGFAAIGAGVREGDGTYNSNKNKNYLWSTDGDIDQTVNAYRIQYNDFDVDKFTNLSGGEGHTIRCIKVE